MKKFTLLAGILILFGIFCQSLNAETGISETLKYVSPQPNAKYITVQHEIAIRHGEVLDLSTVTELLFEVVGKSSGKHSGMVRLSSDQKTLFFKPATFFDYNEIVTVQIKSGLKTKSGVNINSMSYSFKTLKEDNSYLRENHINWLNEENSKLYKDHFDRNQQIRLDQKSSVKLDDGLPVFDIAINNNPGPGYIFLTPHNLFHPMVLPSYSIIMDHYGTPVYYKLNSSHSLDLKIQETGDVSQFIVSEAGGIGIGFGMHQVFNSYMNVVDTFQMGNGYIAEMHDFQLFNDGSSLLFTYDAQIVDMSEIVEGGDPAATVMGCVVQELDVDKNVVFEWSSWDHIAITDATPDINLTAVFIDYCHVNAIERDDDGNILLSFRNTDEIIKVNRESGELMWRLNAFRDDLNDFTFLNDTIKFSHQHDIRRLENGNITIFDNGNLHYGPYSRICEYALDEVNMTAELVWVYPPEPGTGNHFGFATGNAHRQANGNTMIGWGISFPIVSSALIFGEVTSGHQTTYAVYGNDTLTTYRAHKYMWETDLFSLSKDTIDWGEFSGYTPQPYIIQVTNNSDEPITITGAHNRTAEFFTSSSFPVNIAGGATENITINYFPSNSGNFEDALTIMCQKGENEMIGKQVVLMGYTIDEDIPNVSFDPEDEATDIILMPKLKISFDEKLYKQGGEMITNDDLQDILFLNPLGDPTPFNAWITWYDNKRTEIIIQPLDYLDANTLYYWGVNENTVQDWAGNAISEEVYATFSTGEELGVENIIEVENVKLYPNPHDGNVILEFENESQKTIWVYDLNGNLIKEVSKTTGKSVPLDLTNEPTGVYLIQVIDILTNKTINIKTLKH